MPYYLPITGGRIVGYIPFLWVLELCEIQTVSFRIWTWVTVYISLDNNHFTTSTLIYIYIYIYICVCVCAYIYIYIYIFIYIYNKKIETLHSNTHIYIIHIYIYIYIYKIETLHSNTRPNKQCKCWDKESYSLQGKCLQKNVVYRTTVKTNNSVKVPWREP